MNCSELNFKIKTASCESIVEHLANCADCFNPPLYTYVEIEKYAKKIFVNGVTFESWDGENLVGLVATYFNNNETKIGFITNISVLEEYQGSGIASELIKNVICFGRKNSFVKLVLELNINNMKAFKLYKKHGFVVTEQNKNNTTMNYTILTDQSE